MSEDAKRLTPARLRAMAEWFREFAALASVEQRHWQMQLARYYERLAEEREAGAAADAEAKRRARMDEPAA